MIAAGVAALVAFSLVDLADGWLSKEEVVEAVFVAMLQTRHGPSQDHLEQPGFFRISLPFDEVGMSRP
jgi:hypothetical protein